MRFFRKKPEDEQPKISEQPPVKKSLWQRFIPFKKKKADTPPTFRSKLIRLSLKGIVIALVMIVFVCGSWFSYLQILLTVDQFETSLGQTATVVVEELAVQTTQQVMSYNFRVQTAEAYQTLVMRDVQTISASIGQQTATAQVQYITENQMAMNATGTAAVMQRAITATQQANYMADMRAVREATSTAQNENVTVAAMARMTIVANTSKKQTPPASCASATIIMGIMLGAVVLHKREIGTFR
jgi:hypothetical protein